MNRKELDPTQSPAAAFGAELRRLREERGWTQQHVAHLTGYSAVHVSAVETGRKPSTEAFSRRLDQAFGTQGHFEREWRKAGRSVLLEGFTEFLRSEADSVALRLFEINVIPGLLQTPAYTRTYQAAWVRRGASTQQQANERAALLRQRQERMAAQAPRLHVVMDESCLRRAVGGPEVMAEQLRYLEEAARHPRIVLQVSPFSLGEDRPFAHPITLLTLPRGVMVGYSETQKRGFLEREPDTLAEWASEYDHLQVEALPRAASIDFIREVRKGFDHG
ncbi:helix-turn-helix domain-containing protein [Kitasatospora sp. NPDC056327]|uniref:helix-turn-helix domain-containing protein n=1 Tax=Kitasatospora sp. NPDC056327 TaxID=3345785 RepID=UPI0035D74906